MNLSPAQREQLRLKYGGHCAYCGVLLTAKWHADHVLPVKRETVYRRGQGHVPTGNMRAPHHDHIDNLTPACVQCNINKHDLSLSQWRKQLEQGTTNLRKYSGVYRHALRFKQIIEQPPVVIFYFETYVARKRILTDFYHTSSKQ